MAQTGYIELTRKDNDRVKIIQEGKRIILKTTDGHKFSGRFHVENQKEISIRGNVITISDIAELRKKSMLEQIIGWAGISFGGLFIGSSVGILIGGSSPEFAIAPLLIGSLMAGGGYFLTTIPEYYPHTHKINIVMPNRKKSP